ncbi:Ran-binding protein 9 [Ceratobasidium sp. AG-Ba]|nr:Ran-binding protein 9 [Ceratobasidium sp. AG-Ba]
MAEQPAGSSAVWHPWDVPPLTFGSTDSAIQLTAPPPPQSILRLEPRMATSRPQSAATGTGAFQPRVVSGTLPRDLGGWGPSQSPSRLRPLLGPLSPPPHQPEIVSAAPMQRPAYLEQSALRRFLQPDARPPEHAAPPFARSPSAALSFMSDSDDDYGTREARGTPTPEPGLDPISGSHLDRAIRVPTRWNPDDKHSSLVLSSDGREVRYPSPTQQRSDKEAAAIRANYPMPPACGVYYFEVEIIEKGAQGHIGIGFSTSKVQLNRLPGWEPFSWGYHGDDGNSFAGQSEGTPYGPVFGTGDVIGCGVDFTEGRAFYTKNGEFLKKVFRDLKGELYPSVGLRTPKERVLANFGQQPFRFDIATYVMQQKDRVWRDIQRTPLDVLKSPTRIVRAEPEAAALSSPEREAETLRRPLRALVLSYLTHHGYSSTARALRATTINPPTTLGGDTSMDEERQVEHELEQDEDDTAARQRIVRAVSVGDIDSALAEIESQYPKFVAADRDEHDEETGMDADIGDNGEATNSMGMVMFRLRCRKLVEMVLAAEGDDLDEEASPDTPTRHSLTLKGKDKGKGKASRDSMDLDGDVDMSPTEPTSGRGLAAALEYGQFLHQKYGKDRRPGVAAELRAAAGLVAYTDPRTALGPAGALVCAEARVKLADEVNKVILSSKGRPEHTALESVFKQASAVVDTLAREGVGKAAFADVDREFGSSADFGDGRGAIGLRLVEG